MYIKKVVINQTEARQSLKKFDFITKSGTIAKYVFLIGKNGSGKTKLLSFLREFFIFFQQKSSESHQEMNTKLDENYATLSNNSVNIRANKVIDIDREIANNSNSNSFIFCENFVSFCQQNKKKQWKFEFISNEFNIGEFIKYLKTQQIKISVKMYNFRFDVEDVKNNILDIYNEWKIMSLSFNNVFKLLNEQHITINNDSLKKIEQNFFWYSRYYFLNHLLSYFQFRLPFKDSDIKIVNQLNSFFVYKVGKNKDDEKIIFDNLSSGEKHIFAIMFKMLCSNSNCIYLFDELENSFYPKQQELLSKILISIGDNIPFKQQFFIATHSPFILKKFLNHSDAVIINVENGENIKNSENKKLLLNKNTLVSYDEILYLYYDVITSNYYLNLYEKLMSKFDIESYADMDNFLINNKDKINGYYEKKKLIPFYLVQLWDGNYTDWNSFATKFDNNEWKENEKNKPIIDDLAIVLNCPNEQINSEKINGLDEQTKEYTKIIKRQKNLKKNDQLQEINNWLEQIEEIRCIKHWWLNKEGEIKEGSNIEDLWHNSTNLTRFRHIIAHGFESEKNFLFYKNHPQYFKNNNDYVISKTNNFYSKIFSKNKQNKEQNEEIDLSILRKYIELMRTILIYFTCLKQSK